ncbi:MAG: tRNA pseudouridine(55) synthase TruB [Betaproteobacteria bacterium]|nr:tRNA pseudouridine(55) synthase TruB [Betaproteobacteria bacterium]
MRTEQVRRVKRKIDGALLLNKPKGMSSNAALQRARWLLQAEKAGHTGTLDPMATGLLPLCFGEATKFSADLLHADKTYRAKARLGVTTTTGDAEGEIREIRPVCFDAARLAETLAAFTGEIRQIPPMHSALKLQGRPLYELARQGVEVTREARPVWIHRLELLACELTGDAPWLELEVCCGKGTYIRALAEDIGEALGCGAHLAELCRTAVGDLTLTMAHSTEELETLAANEPQALTDMLLPVDHLLLSLPVACLSDTESERFSHGNPVEYTELAGEGTKIRVYTASSRLLGVGEMKVDGKLWPKRLLAVLQTAIEEPILRI